MLRHVLQIIGCYVAGLFLGTFIHMPFTGAPLAVVFMLGGAFLALPILLIAILVFLLFKKSVLRNLVLWCAAAPFLVVLVWMTIEWQTNYSDRGHDIYWYLSLKNVWERAALAFTCAAISSAFFWYLNRGEARPARRATGTSG